MLRGEGSENLILFNREKAEVTQICLGGDLAIEIYCLTGEEERSIRDTHIAGQYLSVLLERNEIQVINLQTKQKVFKATDRNVSGQLTRLFYLNPM